MSKSRHLVALSIYAVFSMGFGRFSEAEPPAPLGATVSEWLRTVPHWQMTQRTCEAWLIGTKQRIDALAKSQGDTPSELSKDEWAAQAALALQPSTGIRLDSFYADLIFKDRPPAPAACDSLVDAVANVTSDQEKALFAANSLAREAIDLKQGRTYFLDKYKVAPDWTGFGSDLDKDERRIFDAVLACQKKEPSNWCSRENVGDIVLKIGKVTQETLNSAQSSRVPTELAYFRNGGRFLISRCDKNRSTSASVTFCATQIDPQYEAYIEYRKTLFALRQQYLQ